MRHRAITSTPTRLDRNRHRVQGFNFVDEGAKVGKVGNTFTLEFVLPSNRFDDLSDDLRQPTQGMGFVKRERISSLLQEVAACTNHCFQVDFYGLPVEQDDRTRIPRRFGVRFQVQGLDERSGGSLERYRVEGNF